MRVSSPARALTRYVTRYRLRYAAGIACLGAATLLSLAIPRTVQRAVEALEADAGGAPVGAYVGIILLLALGNGVARLGSRFAMMGSAQRVEYDVRNDLYRSLLRFPPAFYARHSIGDLMARSSSDISAVRVLAGFGAVSFISTVFAFVGALGAMIAVDPWLTLYALAPYPTLVALARRANVTIHERTQAAQDQLGVLSARVQEHLAAMSVVRAYTMEGQAAAEFDRANGEYLRRSLALGRTLSQFVPLTGLITGLGALIVLWLGGRAVMDGRLTLGALVAVSCGPARGETVAVGGHTGSGKPTLGARRARLWGPPAGTVFVGGRDVVDVSLGTLRGALGYVPQEAFLFSRSISDNVTLGRSMIAPDVVRAAAAVAGVADEVERFPAGWETVVGERGLTVSGGQRQRLALARALAGAPAILVLDDVFASVDAAKEEEIVENLRRAAWGRTVLLMTHRLRAARAADRVVVLAEGRVAETGTHDELLGRGGLYAQLWRIQQLEEEIARA